MENHGAHPWRTAYDGSTAVAQRPLHVRVEAFFFATATSTGSLPGSVLALGMDIVPASRPAQFVLLVRTNLKKWTLHTFLSQL